MHHVILVSACAFASYITLSAFVVSPRSVCLNQRNFQSGKSKCRSPMLRMSEKATSFPRLENVPEAMMEDIFILKEEETGRVIECFADKFAYINEQKYFIGHPCDWCVSIGCPDADGNLEPLPLEGDLMDEVFQTLSATLEQDDVHLFRTPVTLTLQGDFLDESDESTSDSDYDSDDDDDDADYDHDDSLKYEIIQEGDGTDYDESDFSDEEDRDPKDINSDKVELIASFWHENIEYSLVKHLDPILLVAKTSNEGEDRYVLLSEKEASIVNPVLEELLQRNT